MKLPFIVVDIESTGLDPHTEKLHGFSIAISETRAHYFPAWNIPHNVRTMLQDPTIDKVNQNIRFDAKFLKLGAGIELRGAWYCTLQMAQLVNENVPNGLKEQAARLLGPDALKSKRALDERIAAVGGKHVGDLCRADLDDPSHPHLDVIAEYCNEDVLNAYKIYKILGAKLDELELKCKDILNAPRGPKSYLMNEIMPAEKVLCGIELRGIAVNRSVIDAYGEELTQKQSGLVHQLRLSTPGQVLEGIEKELLDEALAEKKSDKGKANVLANPSKYGAVLNWNSADQVGRILTAMGNKLGKTKAGNLAVNESALVEVGSAPSCTQETKDFLKVFSQYQNVKKDLSTYVGNEDTGLLSHVRNTPRGPRVYAEYPQLTDTGRTSSRNPNMQNLPRGSAIKRAFVPTHPDNVFVYADFSQVELRIAAHLSQDEIMLDWFRLGKDPHRETAAILYSKPETEIQGEERQVGKTFNFKIIFDAGPFILQKSFSEEVGVDMPIEDVKALKEAWFASHPAYARHLDWILDMTKRYKTIYAENGRLRRLPDIILGDYLSWKHGWTGPKELTATLLKFPGEVVDHKELTNRAGKRFAHAKKQAFNFPVQSLGASITKAAMNALTSAGYEIVNTVHDSMVIELPKTRLHEVPWITKLITNAYTLSVPLAADVKILNSLHEKDVFSIDQTTTHCIVDSATTHQIEEAISRPNGLQTNPEKK